MRLDLSGVVAKELERKRRIVFLFVSIFILLLISSLVSYYNLTALVSSQEREEQSFNIRWSLSRILSHLVDAETAQRGFIITGIENFLQPYDAAVAEIPGEMSGLKNLLPR